MAKDPVPRVINAHISEHSAPVGSRGARHVHGDCGTRQKLLLDGGEGARTRNWDKNDEDKEQGQTRKKAREARSRDENDKRK